MSKYRVALSWSLKENSADFKMCCILNCAIFPKNYNMWRNQLAVLLKPPATDQHQNQNAVRHYPPSVASHVDEKVSNILSYRMDITHRER